MKNAAWESLGQIVDLLPRQIKDHPALFFSLREGYTRFAFGCRLGPHLEPESILHDMAHAIEFDGDFDRRAKHGRMMFGVPHKTINGQWVDNYSDWAATRREIRTLRFQEALARIVGAEFDLHSNLRTMDYMGDWYLVPGDSDESRMDRLQEYYAGLPTPNESEMWAVFEKWLDKTALRLMEIRCEADPCSLSGNARRVNGSWEYQSDGMKSQQNALLPI